MRTFKGVALDCTQCGWGKGEHKWICKGDQLPVSCPRCKSYHWNEEKVTFEGKEC